uniref:Reverse transcriptase domain-containing protein n=1 Tax=Anolis carolinensis TaxID=28377 RepID=A0A803TRG2_ANOCA
MNLALTNGIIPESWKEAEIIMIYKEGTNSDEVQNYRPISLLNNDYKIFTKILANQFKTFLADWVSEEQTGFLPNRSVRDNIRTIIDTIEYYEVNQQKVLGLLSLDAEKAFDKLNWDFFKVLIQELDVGWQFQNGIKAIYNEQGAKIRINGQTTENFPINKGTRQGCPLSPLIFIFALELLIRNIKKDKNLKGMRIDKQEYKVRAFADDIICIIENPKHNIQIWLDKIEEFGKLAGLKINKNKTKILTKNMTNSSKDELREESGLDTPLKIKYLGIWISAKNNQLLELNYITKWKEIRRDLDAWKNLNLSLLGRVATIKMTILPKILYLFQNIPIIRNNNLFKVWQWDISRFIWNNKKPRIKHSTMITPKNKGGVGLPDLRMYHEACAMDWLKEWTNLQKIKILTLEGHDLRRGWHGYLWYNKVSVEKNFRNHFIRSSLIKVWEKYKNYLYTKTSLWLSPLEANQRRLLGWIEWPTYKDILKKESLIQKSPQIKDLIEIQKNL